MGQLFPPDVVDCDGTPLCVGSAVRLVGGLRAGSVGQVVGWNADLGGVQVVLGVDAFGPADVVLVAAQLLVRTNDKPAVTVVKHRSVSRNL